jgi:hypothetical protein
MSQAQARDAEGNAADVPPLRVWHYQAWCGICLAFIFLGQLEQGIILSNFLAILPGLLSILPRFRWSFFVFLLGIVVAQTLNFFLVERQLFDRRGRELEVHDFLLALGILGYAIGQHRLQGLWQHVWPLDPRERAGEPRPTFLGLRPRQPIVPHRRREEHLRPGELLTAAFLVPALTVLGMVLFMLTRPERGWLGLPQGLAYFLVLFSVLLLGAWLIRQVLVLWHAWTLRGDEALLFLQDQLWAQLRGEQRRIERWRAWKKVEDTTK